MTIENEDIFINKTHTWREAMQIFSADYLGSKEWLCGAHDLEADLEELSARDTAEDEFISLLQWDLWLNSQMFIHLLDAWTAVLCLHTSAGGFCEQVLVIAQVRWVFCMKDCVPFLLTLLHHGHQHTLECHPVEHKVVWLQVGVSQPDLIMDKSLYFFFNWGGETSCLWIIVSWLMQVQSKCTSSPVPTKRGHNSKNDIMNFLQLSVSINVSE